MERQPDDAATTCSSAGLTTEERAELENLFRKTFFSVDAAKILRRDAEGCDAVVDVSYTVQGAGRRGRPSRTVRQTVACFMRPGLGAPGFSAQPSSSVGELIERVLRKLTGMPVIDLPEHAELTQRYSVMSFQPDSTRQVFTPAVAEALKDENRWSVKARGGCVAVYRRARTVPPADRASFYDSASRVAAPIIAAAADAEPAEVGGRGEEAVTNIRALGGLIGRRMRSHLVTTRQVDELLGQTPPRTAPRTIRNFAYGGSGFFILFGGGLMFIGTGLVMLLLLAGGDDVPTMLPYLLLGLPVIGLTVLALALRYRRRRRRLLRDGVCQDAEVVKVEPMAFFANGDRLHKVTFETADGYVPVRMGMGPAKLARSFKKRGVQARVLVDPAEQTQALWIEGWAMDAYA